MTDTAQKATRILTILREHPPLLFAILSELCTELIAGPWREDTERPGTWYRLTAGDDLALEVTPTLYHYGMEVPLGYHDWKTPYTGGERPYCGEHGAPSFDEAKARADTYLINQGWILL
jgi:hypothetical protein